MLAALDYTPEEIDWLLAMQDLKRTVAADNSAISRVRAVYVAHKITRAEALAALDDLRVPHQQRDELVATWDIEAQVNVKTLSAAEIASALYYGIVDQATAMAELGAIGYTPLDAWILLSVRLHKPLPDRPGSGLAG
jgi:hypothetical protein